MPGEVEVLRRQIAELEDQLGEALVKIDDLTAPDVALVEMMNAAPGLALTPRQAAMLALLWSRRGRVVAMSRLAAAVSRSAIPSNVLLRTQIVYLRRRFAKAGIGWRIVNVREVGYRLETGEGEA